MLAEKPGGYPRAKPQASLTRELLDLTITVLTEVVSVQGLEDYATQRQALVRALKQADQLYPLVLKGEKPSVPKPRVRRFRSRKDHVVPLGE